MKIALVVFAVALPIVLFMGLFFLYIDGQVGLAVVMVAAFAICAVAAVAFVFHTAPLEGDSSPSDLR